VSLDFCGPTVLAKYTQQPHHLPLDAISLLISGWRRRTFGSRTVSSSYGEYSVRHARDQDWVLSRCGCELLPGPPRRPDRDVSGPYGQYIEGPGRLVSNIMQFYPHGDS
jgi:hypothetical protein